jgi:hypothetical protein
VLPLLRRPLEITDADDATMTVLCLNPDCGDSYPVETDAFNDGGMVYWLDFLTSQKGGRHEDA